MKNVAKCDTWCELQNPVNHRVFERKLRPKPLGRGHVCLGVTHRVTPYHTLRSDRVGVELASRTLARAAGPNAIPQRRMPQPVVEEFSFLRAVAAAMRRLLGHHNRPNCVVATTAALSTATPGQAGLPAEFKHINKRR
ncbi:hypothetical protein DD582_32480, partial [Klebsiella pneumoniae]